MCSVQQSCFYFSGADFITAELCFVNTLKPEQTSTKINNRGNNTSSDMTPTSGQSCFSLPADKELEQKRLFTFSDLKHQCH